MIRLNVWLTLSQGQTIRAGELVVADPDLQGRLEGQFRYSPEYLAHPAVFPLDPIHLPLSTESFSTDRPHSGVHGVFEDSLPDGWGRRLLARRYKLDRKNQRVPGLLELLGGQEMGALSYGKDDVAPAKKEAVNGHHLEELQRLAANFEEDAIPIDDEMALLFQAGSSPGGARPKALIKDKKTAYLAKFSSVRDQFDVVSLEAATMDLARQAGVSAAPTKLVPCGGKKALLVERFDINNPTTGRNHLISMQTLLKADGYYYAGYRDLADIIRRVSSNPSVDLLKLFKQLVFNVMIGNTDDHLKNFCMIYDGDSWKLSPAYDLIPNIGLNREHVLQIGHSTVVDNREVLMQEAKHFGMKRQKAVKQIIAAMYEVVSGWKKVYYGHSVPDRDIGIIGQDINQRMAIFRE
jgi:serine/threonine-protein kinase HipA